MSSRDVVLLSTADWDNPFWTNKQHVSIELAKLGFRVFYIESLGLRRPSLSARDIRRVIRRIFRALSPPRRVHQNIWVWAPVILPLHDRKWARSINRRILKIGVAFWTMMVGLRPKMLWTYNPLTTELFPTTGYSTLVYHCVDEIKAQPGMPVEALDRAELELVRQADIVFTTSPQLTETRSRSNPNTHYLPNVADFEHFTQALDTSIKVPEELERLPRPRVGFVGAISSYKLDLALIRQLAEMRPDLSVVLIGEVGEGDPWTDISLISKVPNIHLLGPRPYSRLPEYLKGIDVALLPNRLNEYTASMFPMKFFEYLAAGRPIVSTDLPALREFSDVASIEKSPNDFVMAVSRALTGDVPPLSLRLARAKQYTYASRMQNMLSILRDTKKGFES